MNYLVGLICIVSILGVYFLAVALCKVAGTADERRGLK